MIFHLHEGCVYTFDAPELALTVTAGDGPVGAARPIRIAAAVVALDVKQWLWRFGVAERDLSETALDDKLLVLGLVLCGLDSALDLLFHTLHVVLGPAVMATHSALTTASLE